MAKLAERLEENAAGDYFVDATCIDCDMCRQIAPAVYARDDGRGQSIVARQPQDAAARMRAAMALVACPTSSIGTADRGDVTAAASAFPDEIGEGVYFCGYASASSYGAASYLIVRPSGNVLIDSPRAAKPLLRRIAELGGVRTMILTHRDDVADHAIFRRELGCERVLHERDVEAATRDVERLVQGDDPLPLDDDLTIVPVPGHTRGSIAVLYRQRELFTGDHLWFEPETGHLEASRSVCWYSWAEQTRSMAKLAALPFEVVLPGHGRRWQAPTADAMRAELLALVGRMSRS